MKNYSRQKDYQLNIEKITYTEESGERYNSYIECTDLRDYGDEDALKKAKELIKANVKITSGENREGV